jgi:hypothetical protein
VENVVVAYLAGLGDGVLGTTSLARNLFAARHAASPVMRVARSI